MNTATDVTFEDSYLEYRRNQALRATQKSDVFSKIANMGTGTGEATAPAGVEEPSVPEEQLQGSQNTFLQDTDIQGEFLDSLDSSTVNPSTMPIENAPSDAVLKEREEKKIGAMDVMSWALRPIGALGEAAIAPFADENYPEGGLAKIGHALSVSGGAFVDALAPSLGEERPDYGGKIVDRHFKEAPDWVKPMLSSGLEVITDPGITLGLPAAKMIQMGIRAKKMQMMASGEEVNSAGIMETGVRKLLGAEGAYDPDELTSIGLLARKVDRGDKPALAQLQKKVDNEQAISLADGHDLTQMNDFLAESHRVFGLETDPIARFSSDTLDADVLKQAVAGADITVRPFSPNLSRLNSEEDVKNMMSSVLKHYETIFEAIRKKSPKLVKGINQSSMLVDLIGRKTNNYGPKKAFALRQLLSASGDVLMSYAKRANISKSDIDRLAMKKMFYVQATLLGLVTGVSSRFGRNLESLKRTAEGTRAQYRQLMEISGADTTDSELMTVLTKFMSKDLSPTQLNRLTEKSERSWVHKGYNGVFEALVNSRISGPMTTGANITSNTNMLMMRPTASYVASLSTFGKQAQQQAQAHIGDANELIVGLVEGVSNVFRMATNSTFNVYRDFIGLPMHPKMKSPEGLSVQHDLMSQRITPAIDSKTLGLQGPVGAFADFMGSSVIRPWGNALLKQDKAFKIINYRMTTNMHAARQAKALGKSSSDVAAIHKALRNNPNEHVVEEAIDMSELYTFTNRVEGLWGKQLHLVAKTPFKFLIMFFRTPTNIIKYGVRNSVVGNVFYDLGPAFSKKSSPAERDLARARIAIGTLVPASIVGFLGEDISGHHDMRDSTERYRASTGLPPYHFRIDGKVYSYAKLEPIRTVLGMMVNYRDAIAMLDLTDVKQKAQAMDLTSLTVGTFAKLVMAGGKVAGSAAKDIAAATYHTVNDNYFFEVMGQIGNILSEVESGSTGAVERVLEKAAIDLTVPNFVSQTNRTYFDDTVREANGYVENVMKRIPGLSTKLPYKPDAFGEPTLYPDAIGPDIVSPFIVSSDKATPFTRRMKELDVNIPRNAREFSFSFPKSLGGSPFTLELTSKQEETFGRMVGKTMKKRIKGLFASKEFAKKPAANQKARIEMLWSGERKRVKTYMMNTDQDISLRFNDIMDAQTRLIEKQQSEINNSVVQ